MVESNMKHMDVFECLFLFCFDSQPSFHFFPPYSNIAQTAFLPFRVTILLLGVLWNVISHISEGDSIPARKRKTGYHIFMAEASVINHPLQRIFYSRMPEMNRNLRIKQD